MINLYPAVNSSKRMFFKSAAVAVGAAVLTSRAKEASAQTVIAAGLPPPSPATTPWVVELPQIRPMSPASLSPPPTGVADTAGGECGRATITAWGTFTTGSSPVTYALRLVQGYHEFHPDLTRLNKGQDMAWSFGGVVGGTLIAARYGEPVIMRIYNELPKDTTGFGSPECSIHLHNLHTPSESDGFTGDYFSRYTKGPTLPGDPGAFKDHFYPNCYAGLRSNWDPAQPYGPANCGNDRNPALRGCEALGTLWFHDHRKDFTAPNVYRGMFGFYLLFDDIDSGNENDTSPTALRLPSGIGQFDIPLAIHDRQFKADGTTYFDQFNNDGFLGDKICVNGKIQPFMKVQKRKYRFRLLDASLSRFYDLVFVDGKNNMNFAYISNDGNLLPAPLDMSSVRIGPAERADLVIDFSKATGKTVYLVNRLEQTDGRGPSGKLLSPGTQILRFDIQDSRTAVVDNSQVPKTLRPLPPLPDAATIATAPQRYWEFSRTNGGWAVNNQFFDVTQPMALPNAGAWEVWTIRSTGNWHHPVHIHFEEGRILSRNGVPPPPHEAGRKDVYVIAPGEEIRILLRFRDFNGKYMMHCHNLMHEDHAMMVRFDVIGNPITGPTIEPV